MTVAAQAHKWRGFSISRDLVDCIFVLGFVTVWVSRRPLIDQFWKMFGGPK